MILETMLQRLFASLVNGPSMNARPHRSRQRCDWMDFAAFASVEPSSALRDLLEKGRLELPARVPAFTAPDRAEGQWTAEEKQARDAHQQQTRLLKKLREMADDALEYVNDHGESCLALGFPLLSLPPADEKGVRSGSRILAPLLLMPVSLQVRTASRAGVTLECAAEGADRLVANPALVAWLERQTGRSLGETFTDETAADPWREVAELLSEIGKLLDLPSPATFGADTRLGTVPPTEALPKGPSVLPSAVLGLFPLSNQSLLRDTRWMLENESALREPVAAFLSTQALHEPPASDTTADGEIPVVTTRRRDFAGEWLVSSADPCQAHAVLAAREAKALVVHGPPGTGKSQTITNMIADHLARGERVLFVCDKRTALDVVKYRLDAVGLGDLCGVVHDPGSDRRDFYMGLRAKLENLADAVPAADPRPQLASVNEQLATLHTELDACRQKIHGPDAAGGESFHSLLGQWLDLSGDDTVPATVAAPDLLPAEVDAAATTLDEICRRAERSGYAANPFRGLTGTALGDFLARGDVRETLEAIDLSAQATDAVRPPTVVGRITSTAQAGDVESAAAALRKLAAHADDGAFLGHALAQPAPTRGELLAEEPALAQWLADARAAAPDRTLLASARSAGALDLATVNRHLSALSAWEPIAGSFFKKLFAGAAKATATAALAPLGLGLADGWQPGLAFFRALKPRLLAADWLARATAGSYTLPDDATLLSRVDAVLTLWRTEDALQALGVAPVPTDRPSLEALAATLEGVGKWLRQLAHTTSLVGASGLFSAGAPPSLERTWLGGAPAGALTHQWIAQASTLEDMVRVRESLESLPASLAPAVETLVAAGHDGPQVERALRRQAVENRLRARLKDDPGLAAIDGERVEAAFERFARLAQEKLALSAAHVRHLWQHHQKSRLLATTGTQLNKHGSALRQRLYVKGRKALKLRQMLATGADGEGGDPIFDLCPVWMASPSTVAQIFPRHAIFDVVIFDEASQCRLEEALPVLLRGARVVIAGDQKQLPPTRFFESALVDSSDSDAETAEELFHQQQSEAEDLLTAALNLDVHEAYLDVHYRSRNEALIGFSNDHYYGSRLQPIPGHPRNKALSTPIRLHRVDGLYKDRANVPEARAAVDLIAELLAEPAPPSIGVACFNLTQKEAILDALADRVQADADFARRYEEARQRRGRDSFEGLFVKNLENVQGDERDVMIICTTFGPDATGRFRRNFGALSQRDGGRRLNVLVTRARDAIHVITSIPAVEYAVAEETPDGQVPNGRLQLYAYLRYAEQLADSFEQYQDDLEKMRRDSTPELRAWPSATPSLLATAFGRAMVQRQQTGAHVHWGNDGFCVDVACIHPFMPADVTVGVLTDFTRFHKTPDPVEWDIFRTRVLRVQGWELHRLLSPVIFRKADEILTGIRAAHDRVVTLPARHPDVGTAV